MTKQLYIIDYENAHWCGGQLHVCVWAESEDEAEMLAEGHMESEQRELFSHEYEDDEFAADLDQAYTVNNVSVLNASNEYWEYYQDAYQRAAFYPTIGDPA